MTLTIGTWELLALALAWVITAGLSAKFSDRGGVDTIPGGGIGQAPEDYGDEQGRVGFRGPKPRP